MLLAKPSGEAGPAIAACLAQNYGKK